MPLALGFLSPWAALVAAGVALPLAALAAAELRAVRARRHLGLAAPARSARAAPGAALAVLAALLGVAATQPVVRTIDRERVRSDAEAIYVVDTSRSMLASSGAGGVTRFERARDAAARLREELSEVPTGLASLTDRVLPLALPTARAGVFGSTLERALSVDSPPPQVIARAATTLAALPDLVQGRLFSPVAKRRLAVVFTDGESRPVDDRAVARALQAGDVLGPVFVRVWNAGERVYGSDRVPEPGYRPDTTSGARLQALARAVDGRVVGPGDTGEAAAEARRLLGKGPVVTRGRQVRSLSLAPYAALASLVPLAFLLWRRNVR
jgi:hypothetical protein